MLQNKLDARLRGSHYPLISLLVDEMLCMINPRRSFGHFCLSIYEIKCVLRTEIIHFMILDHKVYYFHTHYTINFTCSLAILAASFFETCCKIQTDRQTTLKSQPLDCCRLG